jgi:hypothetical protein
MTEKIEGALYKVVCDPQECSSYYDTGDIVQLTHDDGTTVVMFKNLTKNIPHQWISIKNLKLLQEPPKENIAQLEKELAQTKQEVANLETKLAQAKQELERVKPKLKLWQTLNVGDMVQVRAAIQVNGQFEATENVGEFWVDAIVFWVEPIGYSGRLPVHVKIGNISIWIGKDDFRLKFNN